MKRNNQANKNGLHYDCITLIFNIIQTEEKKMKKVPSLMDLNRQLVLRIMFGSTYFFVRNKTTSKQILFFNFNKTVV